jgi:hypothetical protein
MPSSLGSSLILQQLHQVWIVSSTVMFGIYRSVYLDRVAEVRSAEPAGCMHGPAVLRHPL